MTSLLHSFLASEITFLPNIMHHYMGKYYNTTLYNGITWMVIILLIIRFTFEWAVNALLRKMGFKEYLRIRLKRSLWYLGFYTCSYLYCSVTLWKNGISEPDELKFLILNLTEPISGHLILGYVLLCAFFVSSCIWEGLLCSFPFFNYLFLSSFVAFTFFLSYLELAVLLAHCMSAYHIMTELSRCLTCSFKFQFNLPHQLIYGVFMLSNAIFVNAYLVVIPTKYILPIGRGLSENVDSIIMISLNLSLWGWYLCELYMSPMYRLILHHRCHKYETADTVPQCLGSAIECALFQPRDDIAYNLSIIRKEIKQQEARMRALRQPKKSARMLLQTLRCVAAINRHVKRRALKEVDDGWDDENEEEISNEIFDMNSNEHSTNCDKESGPSVAANQTTSDTSYTNETENNESVTESNLDNEQEMPLEDGEL